MRYKLLLIGTNMAAIDDFFRKAESVFEILTSSMQMKDVKGHIKYFCPDAIVYCMRRETRKSMKDLVSIKQEMNSVNIPFIIFGDQEECDECMRIAENVVNMKLVKPLTNTVILNQLMVFLNDIQHQKELAREAEKNSLALKYALNEASVETYDQGENSEFGPDDRIRILIIDDDVGMVKALKRLLEDNYQVATAVNGKIALRYLETKTVDLILLDYMMPEMDGPQVLEEIRKNPAMADVPVLFLTGAAEKSKIQKALILRPQGYLLKPIDKEKLIEKIEAVLKR